MNVPGPGKVAFTLYELLTFLTLQFEHSVNMQGAGKVFVHAAVTKPLLFHTGSSDLESYFAIDIDTEYRIYIIDGNCNKSVRTTVRLKWSYFDILGHFGTFWGDSEGPF